MKSFAAILAVLSIVIIIAPAQCSAQAPSPKPDTSQAAENPDLTYHFTVMLPQYRFLDTSGNPGRVGEYGSLQQSLGGDLSLKFVDVPQQMTFRSTASVISRDDYDAKSRFTFGKWFDLGLENRSFVRHLDDTSFFAAGVISPDIIRTDSIPPDSLLGIRRRMNKAYAKIQLPSIPVKLFVKGGWGARDGTSQMQYYDMGGSGQPPDTECANCHSASQYRSLNYTTRNLAGGAEITLGRTKLTYQHQYTSFNERRRNPLDFYGTAGEIPPVEDIPYTPAGLYVHSVFSRHTTQADSVQISMAVSHHLTFNGNASYARSNNLFAHHSQNAFNADATLTWNPVSRLRAIVQFHQQNLLNDFAQTFTLSPADPNIYTFGNPSLHRHWAGLKLAYRVSRQLDLESYYTRMNITRSNASLWPQLSSPDNTDRLFVVPASFSNTVGTALHFHSEQFWNVRTGYEWTGTHNPGYLTDPRTNHRVFGDVTLTPVHWLTFSNDASIVLQKSFPAIQRTNHLYVDTAFLTLKPVPQWSISGGYTYLQDSLRTDITWENDPAAAVYTQPLVPYKEISQTFSIRSGYELKKRLGLNVNFAHSLAHSGMRPDVNPADYPPFPPDGGVDPAAFAAALGLSAGLVSQVNVPQTIIGTTGDYHFRSGFDGGLRFDYGSYRDYVRPDLNGKLRSYTVFFGRAW